MVQKMMKLISNARMAAVRAQSQWFKDYWNGVADHLETEMRSKYG